MEKNQLSGFINFWKFILAWEDSGEMQADLRIDIQICKLSEYFKTLFWITASIMLSLLICNL